MEFIFEYEFFPLFQAPLNSDGVRSANLLMPNTGPDFLSFPYGWFISSARLAESWKKKLVFYVFKHPEY